MNRHAASGIDGQSNEHFAGEMEQRVEEICAQLKEGTYRAPPVRQVEIPKGPGKIGTRPLGIPTVADRLLQRAILEAVYEADFLDCSYGFRPGRNPHHALQALRLHIVTKKVSHVFEADIRSYFTRIDHQWLRRMVAHRIADPMSRMGMPIRLLPGWSKLATMSNATGSTATSRPSTKPFSATPRKNGGMSSAALFDEPVSRNPITDHFPSSGFRQVIQQDCHSGGGG